MKNWSLKRKIIGLCSGLVALTIGIGAFEWWGGHTLKLDLVQMSEVELPGVQNMALADMMHDGLRAVVYTALFVAENGNEAEKLAVKEELKEFTQNMNIYIGALDGLNFKDETKKAIAEAKPEVANYIQQTEYIVGTLFEDRKKAIEALPVFDKAFSSLEEKLGVLGELIEKDAEANKTRAVSHANSNEKLGLGMLLAGAVFSIFLTFFMVKDLLRSLGRIVSELNRSTGEVSAASSAASSTATELSEASTQQASSLQETMASIEEISSMVGQNADSANKAKGNVEENQRASDECSLSVDQMVQAIGEIKLTNEQILRQMEDSNKEFSEIVKIITEIGDKTKVINDIVFQTKLLSFNASVEAARAGEHGKGFAVVAEEVGNLARMSGSAAKEITDMLGHSINKVNSIVSESSQKVDRLVEIGKDKISMGQSRAESCKQALNKISNNAKTISEMVGEIAHASKEQAQGVQEINKAISQMDQVVQQNTQVSQHSSSQAEQLRAESLALKDTVLNLVKYIGIEVSAAQENAVAKTPHRETSPKHSNLVSDQVLDFKDYKAKGKGPSVASAQPTGATQKKAVGESFPSSDDPNFEEF